MIPYKVTHKMASPTYVFKFKRTTRPCRMCGKKYRPNSPNQKDCAKCRAIRIGGKK